MQAVKTVQEASRISEIVADTRTGLSGAMHIAVGPSIAPYLLPGFIRVYGADFPQVELTVEEMRLEGMLEALKKELSISLWLRRDTEAAKYWKFHSTRSISGYIFRRV